MQTPATDFSPLPDELLTTVCRFVGITAALPTLLCSTRLHSAWQRAVESLRIETHELTEKDIHTIQKYTGLKKLELIDLGGPVLPWLLVGKLAPSLTQLSVIKVVNAEAFSILKTIHFCEGLRTRLLHLCIHDYNYTLLLGDLIVLKDLPALESLDLVCSSVDTQVPDFASAFKSLRAMTLTLADAAQLKTQVLSRFPGSITSLRSLRLELDNLLDPSEEQTVFAAFASLTNLEQLHTPYFPEDAATQLQVFLALSKLRGLTTDYLYGQLLVPDALQDLRVLKVDRATVDGSIFSLSSLESLSVLQLDIDPSWRTKTADDCPLKELSIDPDELVSPPSPDETLRNLPTLPQLQKLEVNNLAPTNGSYFHLGSVLRRHAGTLRHVFLGVEQAFEEGLPRELPACTELYVYSVSKHTLQLLSMCSLPVVETLRLRIVDADVNVETDLWWLPELPSLKRVALSLWQSMLSGEQRAAVVQLLAPRNVQVI